MLTKKQLQKCMSGRNPCVPQHRWLGFCLCLWLPHIVRQVRLLQPFKSPFVIPSKRRISHRWTKQQPHLLQYDMIAIIGFCCKKKKKESSLVTSKTLWFFQWSCTDVRVGLWRRLSAKELTLLNCGVGEDSWESLGLQGDPTSPFWRRSALGFLWREWC